MKKVVIVEDDQWLAESYHLILQKNDWQVAHAVSAEEAIELIDMFQPQVVLLDFILPVKNAPTLLNELQSHSDLSALPVVLCSSLSLIDYDTDSLAQYGVREVLDKARVTPGSILLALEKARIS